MKKTFLNQINKGKLFGWLILGKNEVKLTEFFVNDININIKLLNNNVIPNIIKF